MALLLKLAFWRLGSLTMGNCFILFPERSMDLRYGNILLSERKVASSRRFLDRLRLIKYLSLLRELVFLKELKDRSIFLFIRQWIPKMGVFPNLLVHLLEALIGRGQLGIGVGGAVHD